MKPLLVALGLCCLLVGVANAEGETYAPMSENALHFRLEVGVRSGHFVTGWLDTRQDGGESFDTAVLDLDGDGKAETLQAFGKVEEYRTKAMVYNPRVSIEHEDATWVLDLRYSRFQATDGTARKTSIRWAVTRGEFYAWFINGQVTFHATAAAAAEAAAIRMGPPFRFQTGTRTQGRDALVTVGLKDVNGCTLRLARLGKGEVRPHVTLAQDGEQKFEAWASYG